jgi:ribonuclease-3
MGPDPANRPLTDIANPGVTEPSGDLAALARQLGHDFADPALLARALTHTSVDAGGGPDATYERLEFLGDRVLGLIIAEMLLDHFPEAAEGELAPRFNELVRRESVARVARAVDLGPHLRLGPGEHQTGGRDKTAILADVGESVIAALFLDGGLDVARGFVRRHWTPLIGRQTATPRDAKTELQEWSQGEGLGLPTYREAGRSGPDHAPRFTVEVTVSGCEAARGTGPSKREAERLAAEAFLARERIGDRV